MKKILRQLRNALQCAVNKLNQYLGEQQPQPVNTPEVPVKSIDVNVSPIENISKEAEVVVADEKQIAESLMKSDEEFLSLCKRLAEMVKQYDMMAKQMPDGEVKDLLEDMSEQIISSMVLSGCKPITKETAFNPLRHRPIPYIMAEYGTQIQSTLRMGVEIKGQVLIPAMVRI